MRKSAGVKEGDYLPNSGGKWRGWSTKLYGGAPILSETDEMRGERMGLSVLEIELRELDKEIGS